MGKFFKTHLPFTRAAMQSAATYRLDFLAHAFGHLLAAFIAFSLWRVAFNEQEIMEGFTIHTMVFYLFLSFSTTLVTNTWSGWSLSEEIRDGRIAMRLIRPSNFSFELFFLELGDKMMGNFPFFVLTLLGLEAYHLVIFGLLQFNLVYFLLHLVSLLLAMLLNFFFVMCFGYLAFVLKYIWGLNMLRLALVGVLSGTLIPLVFFPEWAQTVLQILPFSSMIFTPVMLYLGMFDFWQTITALALQVGWLAFFWALSVLIWKLSTKKLTIQGG